MIQIDNEMATICYGVRSHGQKVFLIWQPFTVLGLLWCHNIWTEGHTISWSMRHCFKFYVD